MVSSYRLISKVISASFTRQNDATSCHGVVVCLPSCRDCNQSVSQFPLLGLCHMTERLYWGGGGRWKPIPAVPWPTWACIWQCWNVEVSIGWSLGGNSGSHLKKFKHASRCHPGLHLAGTEFYREAQKPCGGGSHPTGRQQYDARCMVAFTRHLV
jgi:hypothetical protein